MAFTAYPEPDNVQFEVEGVFCMNCEKFSPGAQDWCLWCGSNALVWVEAGTWHGGPPDRNKVHHVEHDLSTGLVGYSRLTPQQVTEWKAMQAAMTADYERFEAKRQQRIADLRVAGEKDPSFELLLRHLGILPTED